MSHHRHHLLTLSLACTLAGPTLSALRAQDPDEPAKPAAASHRHRADLVPPRSLYAVPDDEPPAIRPVIDIVQDGRLLCGGKTWYDPKEDAEDYTPMRRLLAELKARPGVTTQAEVIGGKTVTLVQDPVLIRADRHTEWHYVGKLMEWCAHPEIGFWKIELGMSESNAAGEDRPTKVPAYLPRDVGLGPDAEPVEQLQIQIVCDEWGEEIPRQAGGEDAGQAFDLRDHRVHWNVGPRRLVGADALARELKRVFADPTTWQTDRESGRKKPLAVVIQPNRGATYGDVATVIDVVHAAGFDDVTFGGGMGVRSR